jgi:hypothetical protein
VSGQAPRRRFNDAHKDICAALGIDDEQVRREIRPYVMRCWARGLSSLATLALVKEELKRRATEQLNGSSERSRAPETEG